MIYISPQIAIVNALLFLASIGGFLLILIHNGIDRASVIKTAKALPIPGCPVVHTGIEWAQWVPGARAADDTHKNTEHECLSTATIYEGILFGEALYKTTGRVAKQLRMHNSAGKSAGGGKPLYNLVLQDNLLYFFGYVGLDVLPYPETNSKNHGFPESPVYSSSITSWLS